MLGHPASAGTWGILTWGMLLQRHQLWHVSFHAHVSQQLDLLPSMLFPQAAAASCEPVSVWLPVIAALKGNQRQLIDNQSQYKSIKQNMPNTLFFGELQGLCFPGSARARAWACSTR